jgi:hypothetical protein
MNKSEIAEKARQFYEQNATNVVNVPRPGHSEDKSGWDGVRRASQAKFVAQDALVMTLPDAIDFAAKFGERAIAESQADELQKLKVSYQALWDDRDKMEKRLMGFVREWKRRAITAESQAPKPYSFDVASDEEIARRASGAAQEVSPPSPMTANEAIDLLNARIPVKDKQIILETVRENRGDTRELKAALRTAVKIAKMYHGKIPILSLSEKSYDAFAEAGKELAEVERMLEGESNDTR